RAMFWIGGLPALLALYIRSQVPESEAWKQHRAPSPSAIVKTLGAHWKSFAYLVLLMTFMMCLSHGTQDLYPDFLKSEVRVAPKTVSDIAVLYTIGAVVGAIIFGHLSEIVGRRRSMMLALCLCLAVMPLWAFGNSTPRVAAGSFLMQAGVQGAWHHPGAPERTGARRRARPGAGTRVPDGHPGRGADEHDRVRPARPSRL